LPGDFITERPVNSFIHPAGLPIATPHVEVLRRPRESAQFVSLAFGQKARDAGIAVSMGSKGCAYDNAVAESFFAFATLKKELVHRRSWPSRRELISEVFESSKPSTTPPADTPRWATSRPRSSRRSLSPTTTRPTANGASPRLSAEPGPLQSRVIGVL